MGNSREIITHFYINKVGYLHRQPISDVLSNNSYYEKQQVIFR